MGKGGLTQSRTTASSTMLRLSSVGWARQLLGRFQRSLSTAAQTSPLDVFVDQPNAVRVGERIM